MKLKFQKDALVNGINIVMKAVPSKTTMSILECILVDASGSEIKLTGNDMELIDQELEKLLNTLGAEGWELVQKADGFYFFKREKSAPSE